MRITVDPGTHELSQQPSPCPLPDDHPTFERSIAQQETGGGYGAHADEHAAMLATDMLIAFALGFIATTRFEMAFRARRLLADARLA